MRTTNYGVRRTRISIFFFSHWWEHERLLPIKMAFPSSGPSLNPFPSECPNRRMKKTTKKKKAAWTPSFALLLPYLESSDLHSISPAISLLFHHRESWVPLPIAALVVQHKLLSVHFWGSIPPWIVSLSRCIEDFCRENRNCWHFFFAYSFPSGSFYESRLPFSSCIVIFLLRGGA